MTQLQLQLACLGGLVATTLWLWWRGTDAVEWREHQRQYNESIKHKETQDGNDPVDHG